MSCGRASPGEALPPSPQNAERMNNVSNWVGTLPFQAQGDLAILNSTLGSGCVRRTSPNTASNSGQSTASSCGRCGETIDANGGPGLDSINAPSLNSSSGACSRQSTRNDNVAENSNSSWLTSGSGLPPSQYGQRLRTPTRQQPPPEPERQQLGLTPIMNACFGNFSPESENSNRIDEVRPPVFNPSPISERQPCAGSEWASSPESSPVSIEQPNYSSFISSSTGSGSAASPVVCGRQSRPGTPYSVPGQCSSCTPPQQRPVCGDNFNMNMSGVDGINGMGAPSLNSSVNSGQWNANFNRVNYQTTGQGLESVGAPSFNSSMSNGASRPGTPTFYPQPAPSPVVCGRPAVQSGPGTPYSVPGPYSPCTPPQPRPVCGDNFSMNMSGGDGISGMGAPSLNSSVNSGQWDANFNRVNYQTTGQGLESVGAPSFNSNMSSNMASRPATPMGQNVAANFSPQAMSSGAGQSVCCSSQNPFYGQSPNINLQQNGMPPSASGCYRQQNTGNFGNGSVAMASPVYGIQALDNSMGTTSGSSGFQPQRVSTVCGDNLNLSGGYGMGISQQSPPGYNSYSNSGSSNNSAPCPRNQNFGNNIGFGSPMYNSTAINDPAAQACQRQPMPSPVCGNAGVQAMTHSMNASNASSMFQPPRVSTPCGDRLDFNMNGGTGINNITPPSNIHSSGYSNPVCGDNLNLSGGQGMGISQQTPPGFNSFSSSGSSSSNGAPCPRNIDSQGMSNVSNTGGPTSPGGCDGRRIPSPNSVQCLKNKLFIITRDKCPCPPTDPNFLNCNERTMIALRRATDEFIPEHMSRISASAGNQNMQTGQGCGGGYQNMLPVDRQPPALPAPSQPSSSSGSSGGVGPCLAQALDMIPVPSPCPRVDASENQGSMNCGC